MNQSEDKARVNRRLGWVLLAVSLGFGLVFVAKIALLGG